MPMSLDELHQETGIEKHTLANMRLMHTLFSGAEGVLDSTEHVNIQTMLANMIGDMSLNRQLGTLSIMSGAETGIGTLGVCALKDISYRTRHLSTIEPEMDRLWANFLAVKDGGHSLVDNEKISLSQFGILYDLANLNNTLKEYARNGLINGNEKLEKLYHHTQRANSIIKYLDASFNESFSMPIGAIIFDDTVKKSEIYGKTLEFFEQSILHLVTKFSHVSKGISVQKEGKLENRISHINPNYQQDKFNLRSFLYSDIYQIKLENLITTEVKTLLQEHLGPNWLNEVQEMFGKIERQIHDANRSAHIHIIAEGGFGRFAQIATSGLQGGHQTFFMNDHENTEVRDDIFGRGKWEAQAKRTESRLLCSEFIGKTIIASIQELNDELKKILTEKGISNIPFPLVKTPISEREKLHLLTPERLLNVLLEKNVVERVSAPSELSKFTPLSDTARLNKELKAELNEAKREDTSSKSSKESSNKSSNDLKH